MTSSTVWRRLVPMRPRDPGEEHRTASELELLTDLCVVVAVGQAAASLHHGLITAHPGHYVLGYVLAFFALSWAWLNFSWFGSAYDNDDALYRLLTIGQIVGVLILAAGVEKIVEGEFTRAVIGYVIMRVSLIVQWLRASRHDPERHRTCLRYAGGIAIVQVAWITFLFLSHNEALRLPLFVLIAVAEVAVPIFAERAGITPWHPHHIAERYGLFFIIVLGEVILSSTLAIKDSFDASSEHRGSTVVLMISGVLIVFSLWWIYFGRAASEVLRSIQGESNTRSYVWGFGHLGIFAATAAIGAAIAARSEYYLEPEKISGLVTSAAISLSAVIALVLIYLLQLRPHDPRLSRGTPFLVVVAVLVVATFLPFTELIVGLALAGLVLVQAIWRAPHSSAGEAVSI